MGEPIWMYHPKKEAQIFDSDNIPQGWYEEPDEWLKPEIQEKIKIREAKKYRGGRKKGSVNKITGEYSDKYVGDK